VPEVYAFFAHEPVPHMIVIIRTDATPAAMSAALRRVVSSLDPGQPVTDVRALDTVLAQSAARPKFFLMILGAFALIAVLLAVIGLFGVMIMIVRQRMREIAVRMALGADSVQVTKLVLGRGGVLVLAGGGARAHRARRLLAASPCRIAGGSGGRAAHGVRRVSIGLAHGTLCSRGGQQWRVIARGPRFFAPGVTNWRNSGGTTMATLNVKNLPDALYRRLQRRARRERRSVAQEVTLILEQALATKEQSSILDLQGLGKELWAKVDAVKHVAAERRAWD
jgi:plasmid stability protein